MTKLIWDGQGERKFETGVDHGVLHRLNRDGEYESGVPWNGLTAVTESPSGAEANAIFADNIKYLSLVSAEEFGGTIEAYTYPEEFELCDGTASPSPGVTLGQQSRRGFGFTYRTLIGNDVLNTEYGFKLHLVYGALAAPSEKARNTVNDSPEAVTFSWTFTTTPISSGVEGLRPSATITIDSTKVDPSRLKSFMDILYGTDNQESSLPLPEAVIAHFQNGVTLVTPVKPTKAGNVLTVPTIEGVVYKIEGRVVKDTVTITKDVIVRATPAPGYSFPDTVDNDWDYKFA